MPTPSELIEEILVKLWALQGQTFAAFTASEGFKLPRLIPAGANNGTIRITEEIDDLITTLAKDLKNARPSLAKSIKAHEWRIWVRTAIGPLLVNVSLSTPPAIAAPLLLDQLNDALTDLVGGLSADSEGSRPPIPR